MSLCFQRKRCDSEPASVRFAKHHHVPSRIELLIHFSKDHTLCRLLPQGRGEVPRGIKWTNKINVEHPEADQEQQRDLLLWSAVKSDLQIESVCTYPEKEELGILAQTLLRLCAGLTQIVLLLFGNIILATDLQQLR